MVEQHETTPRESTITYIDQWLACHPGRKAIDLTELADNHQATVIDLQPYQRRKRQMLIEIARRARLTQPKIALPYNPNVDVWHMPQTD